MCGGKSGIGYNPSLTHSLIGNSCWVFLLLTVRSWGLKVDAIKSMIMIMIMIVQFISSLPCVICLSAHLMRNLGSRPRLSSQSLDTPFYGSSSSTEDDDNQLMSLILRHNNEISRHLKSSLFLASVCLEFSSILLQTPERLSPSNRRYTLYGPQDTDESTSRTLTGRKMNPRLTFLLWQVFPGNLWPRA